MRILTLDIETVPLLDEELSDIQKAEKLKRAERLDMPLEQALSLVGGTSPYFGKIVCIGLHLAQDEDEQQMALIGDEKYILEKFWENLEQVGHCLYVHFNGLGFDVPFILRRSMLYGIRPTQKAFLNLRRFSMNPHFDVKEAASNYSVQNSSSLELLCDFLGISSPKAGEVKASGVAEAYYSGNIDEIAKYCLRDCKATYEAYLRVKNYI